MVLTGKIRGIPMDIHGYSHGFFFYGSDHGFSMEFHGTLDHGYSMVSLWNIFAGMKICTNFLTSGFHHTL